MCPFCLANLGLVVAGTVSTGGLAALTTKVLPKKSDAQAIPNGNERSDENDNAHS
jgi:hypothetical protein